MVTANATTAASDGNTRVVNLPFPGDDADTLFSRADVVFSGLDHSEGSYEVRLFLNNPDADATTARTPEKGYAGRLHVLGHGGCYGDIGHCDVPQRAPDQTDLRSPHPLTPLDTYVTITDALRDLLDSGTSLHTITLVPVSVTPKRSARRPAPELLRFSDVSLQTYLTPADEPGDQTSSVQ
jgi:tyrosinase